MCQRFAIALVATLLLSCGGGGTVIPPPNGHGNGDGHPDPDPPTPRAHVRPRLVIVVVLDQLSSWVLARDLDALPPDGAIRSTIARGAFHHEVVFPVAATLTAPGHASISTGVTPSEHGVFANRVYSRDRRQLVSIVDDGQHPIHGLPTKNASPSVLRVDTVGDALHAATAGRGRVVALSLKERSAVVLAGRRPTAVVFFDKRGGSFTTSTSYAAAIPEWLTAFERARPIAGYLAVWQP